jgi:acetyl-CoA synthetase
MNFAADVVDAAAPERLALVARNADGGRREWRFGEVSDASARLAGTLVAHGAGRGDVVMTLIGSRAEWVVAMVACFRVGAVALPCNEQLRAKDLALRLEVASPALVLADQRNRAELETARPACPVLDIDDPAVWHGEPIGPTPLDAGDPCLITFTSGTSGQPKAVLHAQRYLSGQDLQARAWLGAGPSDLVWCTAATGWSKSARNVFVAPWLTGAAALLHDARFDAEERMVVAREEEVGILCMAPTEYRLVIKRGVAHHLPQLRQAVAAGEPLDPHVLAAWGESTGIHLRDGYGQTETGQLTANALGEPPRPGSMGRPLPGIDLWIDSGELVGDPATIPTFFSGYVGEPPPHGEWRTGDRVHADADGYLYFEGRADDVIISAGYRIGPFEVEAALVSHPAVAEAAVVAAPDDERGAVVRAVVVPAAGVVPSAALAAELQAHVRGETAPYKYPRIVDFATELPKTASGKVRRAALRDEGP